MHVMIDLETTDNIQTAGILTIGAVKFDPRTGQLGDTLYRRLGFEQAIMYGTQSADTLRWWEQQDPRVKAEAFIGEHDATVTAYELADFCKGAKGVWGNGSTFDISILEHWYAKLGIPVPWQWTVRDCRTISDLAAEIGILRKQFVRKGDHHNALDDAVYQAEWVSGMWQGLTRRSIAS